MVKFFRHIRYNLLETEKQESTAKCYCLKYAEISIKTQSRKLKKQTQKGDYYFSVFGTDQKTLKSNLRPFLDGLRHF